MTFPDAIFLNGCSCAGKTSIARGLQERLDEPWLRFGTDDFAALAPPRWIGRPEGFQMVPQPNGDVPVILGEGGLALERAFHAAARGVIDSGLKVIIDDVLLDPRLLPDWRCALAGLDVFFVGVVCSLEELERREAARPERAKGHTRTTLATVHAHGGYDLTVDTTATPTDACVEAIAAAIQDDSARTAFVGVGRSASSAGGP